MSAHCPTAYIGKPKGYESPSPFASISVLSVGFRITRLKGMSMAKNHESSAIAGTSVWSVTVERSGSIPVESQSLTISSVSRRISSDRSARVVKACMLAMRK